MYLRAFGIGGLATGVAGIAGCLSAGAEDSSSPSGDGGSTTAGTGAQGGETETAASTDAGADDDSADPTTSSADGGMTTDGTDAAQSNGKESATECIDASPVDTSGFETYTNSEDGYSIDHPASWSVSDDYPGEAFIEGKNSESVTVTIGDAAGKTADALAEATLKEAEESSTDFEVYCRREVSLSSGQTGNLVFYNAHGGSRTELLVVADEISYTVEAVLVVGATDPEANQIMTAIVESFALGAA